LQIKMSFVGVAVVLKLTRAKAMLFRDKFRVRAFSDSFRGSSRSALTP
jgi:hypothetical protein